MAPLFSVWLKRAGSICAVLGVVLLLAVFARRSFEYLASISKPPRPPAINFTENWCADAWQHDQYPPPQNHYTFKMREGCFDGMFHLPTGHTWHFQPVGYDPGWWWSPWFSGDNKPAGIFRRGENPNLTRLPIFRLQGKEGQEILFYTNDAIPASPPHATRTTENSPPTLLRKIEPDYSEDARRAKFQGAVRISLVVDAEGNATDIHIIDSPGLGLDEKIIEALRQWKFRPAMKNGVPVPQSATVTVNFNLL